MEAFSGLLFNLYRQAQHTPPTKFQGQVLDTTREVIAFDSAIWATGVMGAASATVHTVYVYRQPPEMMENWERIKQHDAINLEAFNRMGQTVNATLQDPYWQNRFHPDAMAHTKRYGMEHVLATIIADPVLRLFSAVSFYRAKPGQAFTESERLFKQNLMPHLTETWNANRFNFMHSPSKNDRHPDHARALCDKTGRLHNASQNFDELMLAEWPDWQGPQLPLVLEDTLATEGRRRYAGRSIVATTTLLNDMFLLRLRNKSALDLLSPRELEVARCFGRGMEYRKIADELNIAPVTVRNHLQAIYATLGVNNKVEMARIILEAEE